MGGGGGGKDTNIGGKTIGVEISHRMLKQCFLLI